MTDAALRIARLLAFVLAVPVLGVGAASLVRWHADREFVWALEGALPAGDPRRNRIRSLADACASADADADEACRTDRLHRAFGAVSTGTGAAGVLVLAAILVGGRAARSDRRRLLALFRPGLYATAAVVTTLIVVHTLIAVVIAGVVAKVFAPRLPLIWLGAILAGAIAGLRAVPRALFGAVRDAEVFAFGGRVSRDEAPALWRQVESTAARLRALPPDDIVLGLDAGFFVTEVPVETPNGPCRGRTLFCSLPLARILTVDEFTAIVAHELGHFRGEDTAFSQRFYPIYRGSTAAIEGLADSGGGGRWVALLPAVAIFDFFLERFALAERHHSRARELLADAASVEATSARTAAAALVKVHAYGPLWPEVFDEAVRTAIAADEPVPREGAMPSSGEGAPSLGALFASAAARADGPAILAGILETHTAHPTDTHPTLAVRLEALGVDLSAIAADALRVVPAEPAAALVPTGIKQEEMLGAIALASVLGPAAPSTASG